MPPHPVPSGLHPPLCQEPADPRGAHGRHASHEGLDVLVAVAEGHGEGHGGATDRADGGGGAGDRGGGGGAGGHRGGGEGGEVVGEPPRHIVVVVGRRVVVLLVASPPVVVVSAAALGGILGDGGAQVLLRSGGGQQARRRIRIHGGQRPGGSPGVPAPRVERPRTDASVAGGDAAPGRVHVHDGTTRLGKSTIRQ